MHCAKIVSDSARCKAYIEHHFLIGLGLGKRLCLQSVTKNRTYGEGLLFHRPFLASNKLLRRDARSKLGLIAGIVVFNQTRLRPALQAPKLPAHGSSCVTHVHRGCVMRWQWWCVCTLLLIIKKLQKKNLQKKSRNDEKTGPAGGCGVCLALGVLSAFEPTAGFVCTSLCVLCGVGVPRVRHHHD